MGPFAIIRLPAFDIIHIRILNERPSRKVHLVCLDIAGKLIFFLIPGTKVLPKMKLAMACAFFLHILFAHCICSTVNQEASYSESHICAKDICIPKSYNSLEVPNGSTHVFLELSPLKPVVLQEVNDMKRQIVVDWFFSSELPVDTLSRSGI